MYISKEELLIMNKYIFFDRKYKEETKKENKGTWKNITYNDIK